MKKISGVYALIDPRDGQIRYIGQSINIKARFGQHKNAKNDLPVSCWTRSLQKNGFNPDLIILQEHYNPIEIEKYWIDRAKSRNLNLLNLHGGGPVAWHSNGRSCKIWIDDRNYSPYRAWLNFYTSFAFNKFNSGNVARSALSKAKEMYSLCATEKEKILFQFHVARIIIEKFNTKKHHDDVAYWIGHMYPILKDKYPELL